jgi:ubiquinone/menaquinone biosynthesis C-methylase UbiE
MSVLDAIYPFINDLALGRRTEHLRGRVTAAARGRVLEIGAGTGLNFHHYAPDVELVAIEPAEAMRRRAVRRTEGQRVRARVRVQEGSAHRLPFEGGEFDVVVATFVLCSVRDLRGALREVRRVLRPEGALSIVEHGVSSDPSLARWQRRADPVWRALFGGCHLTRDILGALREAGFNVEELEAVELPLPTLASQGVIGSARLR